MIPDFENAEKASWKAHSHEWLLAFRDFIDQAEQIAIYLQKLHDSIESLNGAERSLPRSRDSAAG